MGIDRRTFLASGLAALGGSAVSTAIATSALAATNLHSS